MNKPYHERPDWILKAICYYCDNYMLDGQDLRKFKRGAIKHYKKALADGEPPRLRLAFPWGISPQGFDFWDRLDDLMCAITKWWDDCPAPWTDYEKRKIAKMPEVK